MIDLTLSEGGRAVAPQRVGVEHIEAQQQLLLRLRWSLIQPFLG